ncbi:hypothetical protein [Streptomyces sp. NPDC001530]|uniref:hypothetical protein n=1 Tax=Streptomyces sp. NPDC001530 TaxID=3364582 RepID=UPI0036CE5DFC
MQRVGATGMGNDDIAEVPPSRDVHVTIGRVEVRAVHAPAPAPAAEARPAGALMSLAEYVRQRAEGGRT